VHVTKALTRAKRRLELFGRRGSHLLDECARQEASKPGAGQTDWVVADSRMCLFIGANSVAQHADIRLSSDGSLDQLRALLVAQS
jgi:hypothetical protein